MVSYNNLIPSSMKSFEKILIDEIEYDVEIIILTDILT
jgi:hypothetical protein